MGNLAEVLIVLLFPSLLLTGKVAFAARFGSNSERASGITFAILLALVLAVRLLTPEIPE